MEFKIFDYANKIKWCNIPEGEKPRAIQFQLLVETRLQLYLLTRINYTSLSRVTLALQITKMAHIFCAMQKILLIGSNGSLVAVRKMQHILI